MSDKKELNRLWALADDARDREPIRSAVDLMRLAAKNRIPLSPSQLWSLAARLGMMGVTDLCPPAISSFIASLLQGLPAERVLDPCVGAGTLLRPVVEATRVARFVGTSVNAALLDAARHMLPPKGRGDYQIRDFHGEDLANLGEFDIVVSLPPFGYKPRQFVIGDKTLRDDGGHELLLRSSLLLKPEGVGVFVVTPKFHFASNKQGVAKRLADFGLHVDASFQVPAGAFMPSTSIGAAIVVIRRGEPPEQLFAGQVTSEASRLESLLSSYRNRSPGIEPELGAMVSYAHFRGLEQEISKCRVEKMAGRLRLPRKELGDLSTDISRCSPNEVSEKDNAFYLPLIATSPCKLVAAELPSRPNDYVQVVIDPSVADARIVAGFLDSPLGREIRASQASGMTIRRIPASSVSALPVFVPDLSQQQAIVELDQRLRSLSSQAHELHDQLWSRLDDFERVQAELRRLNREDTFPDWLDTLPFPLASILWTYHTLKDRPLKRYLQLDYFFEGLVEFLAVWLMSGLRRDPTVFDSEWKQVRETLAANGLSLERATFGTWATVFERIAKTVRRGLNGKEDDLRFWLNQFACDSRELMDSLVSKLTVNLLKRANGLRNDWRAHGGAVGDAEANRRESSLVELLADFRELVSSRWQAYPLVLPGSGRASGGVFRYRVARVSGVRYPFDQLELECREPLEDGWLHFVSERSGQVCPLLPLVRLGAASAEEKNACYFFNREESGGRQRYVSYHFEDRPEVVEASSVAAHLLEDLRGTQR